MGEARPDCGEIRHRGCLEIKNHPEEKANIHVVKKGCTKATCPSCFIAWQAKEADAMANRIMRFRGYGRPIHVMLSPPRNEPYPGYLTLKKRVYKMKDKVGLEGGALVFHPYRIFFGMWYFSPHFHALGYGWIVRTTDNYESNGWVVKKVKSDHPKEEDKDYVVGVANYLLSHSGIYRKEAVEKMVLGAGGTQLLFEVDKGKPPRTLHSVTWFGALSYGKLRIAKTKEIKDYQRCEYCKAPMFSLKWIHSDRGPPIDDNFKGLTNSDGWEISFSDWEIPSGMDSVSYVAIKRQSYREGLCG